MTGTLILVILSVSIVNGEWDSRVITTLKHANKRFYVYPTVINGLPARTGEMPYLVSFKEPLFKTSKYRKLWSNLCGGSIIAPQKVLTAAHCFEGRNFFYYKKPQRLRVVAGNFTTQLIHSGTTETTSRAQWRKITKVVLHDKFYFPENDIALVFVNIPWQYSHSVGSIPVARRRTDYPTSCISAGFGSINHTTDKVSPVLLIANLFLLSRSDCTKMWEMNMDKFICTYSYMSDVGRGDSGGPLACVGTLDPNEKRGKELLVGVVSGKNFDKTSLFTRLSAFRHWIDTASDAAWRRLGFISYLIVVLNSILMLSLHFFS